MFRGLLERIRFVAFFEPYHVCLYLGHFYSRPFYDTNDEVFTVRQMYEWTFIFKISKRIE